MRAYLNLGLAIVIILAFVFAISQKEAVLSDGRVVYLKLAPVDPRSIMQGDYMRLRYELERVARQPVRNSKARTGYFILNVDEKNIATFLKLDDGSDISPNQILLKHQNRRIVPDSFLFQQGLREVYARAQYGIFRVSGNEHLLVGLADGDLKEIKPPKE